MVAGFFYRLKKGLSIQVTVLGARENTALARLRLR
jgi:hypothetical protein